MRKVVCYLDDIFVIGPTLSEATVNLRIVFDILRKEKLYLSADKVDLLSPRIECLGHKIMDEGVYADDDKMSVIQNAKFPKDAQGMQCFL
ncbi:hypothetical protein DACRYDRAFT_52840, partial [Dacryopinax primogenitus]